MRQPSGDKRRITVPSRDVADGWVSIRRRLLGCIPAARARAASVIPRAAARARIVCKSLTASTPSAYPHAAREGAQDPAGRMMRAASSRDMWPRQRIIAGVPIMARATAAYHIRRARIIAMMRGRRLGDAHLLVPHDAIRWCVWPRRLDGTAS